MATHITSAKQLVDQYMSGVHNEQFRLDTLVRDWSTYEGAAKQVMSCVGHPTARGDYRDGEHHITTETVAAELERRHQ